NNTRAPNARSIRSTERHERRAAAPKTRALPRGNGPEGQGGRMIAAAPQTIHIAVMALGGQGGGVLIDWLVDLAEHAGWTAQATSVAGVAQRTGATIYYVEMVAPTPGRQPILALMPVPGEVDVVIAAEM